MTARLCECGHEKDVWEHLDKRSPTYHPFAPPPAEAKAAGRCDGCGAEEASFLLYYCEACVTPSQYDARIKTAPIFAAIDARDAKIHELRQQRDHEWDRRKKATAEVAKCYAALDRAKEALKQLWDRAVSTGWKPSVETHEWLHTEIRALRGGGK